MTLDLGCSLYLSIFGGQNGAKFLFYVVGTTKWCSQGHLPFWTLMNSLTRHDVFGGAQILATDQILFDHAFSVTTKIRHIICTTMAQPQTRLGGNLVLASLLALASYVPLEWVAKGSLVVCAILFIVDPIPPVTCIVSLVSLFLVNWLSKLHKQHQQQQAEEVTIQQQQETTASSDDKKKEE
jgi:hypothetical protein